MTADAAARPARRGRHASPRPALRANVRVALPYLDAWLRGNGAAAINNLMEDAATAEISRSQLWQWRARGTALDDGRVVDDDLYRADPRRGAGPARRRGRGPPGRGGRAARLARPDRRLRRVPDRCPRTRASTRQAGRSHRAGGRGRGQDERSHPAPRRRPGARRPGMTTSRAPRHVRLEMAPEQSRRTRSRARRGRTGPASSVGRAVRRPAGRAAPGDRSAAPSFAALDHRPQERAKLRRAVASTGWSTPAPHRASSKSVSASMSPAASISS